jgi:hypothetical protein
VKHHAASHDLTDSQLAKISQLTVTDTLLYHRAKKVFDEQVTKIERDFGVQLCSNPQISYVPFGIYSPKLFGADCSCEGKVMGTLLDMCHVDASTAHLSRTADFSCAD